MPQVIKPLQLTLPKVDLIQGGAPLLVQYAQTRRVGVLLLQQQPHIGLHFFRGKTDIMECHDDTQMLQVRVIILPGAHHFLYRAAQAQLSYSFRILMGII